VENESYQLIWGFLRMCFNYEYYADGISRAKQAIGHNAQAQENWKKISSTIQNRQLEPGKPLTLVNHGANQVLDENSDEEAYVWLDKMIANIERTDGQIDVY